MKTKFQKVFLIVLCSFFVQITTANASDRNTVISKINSEYYCEDYKNIITDIQGIDIELSDDEYLKKVFFDLDEHSKYYTKQEYESLLLAEYEQLIDAKINNTEIQIKITHFGIGIEKQFNEYAKTAARRNIKHLVLDLSECPGGYIDVMNQIANQILPKGKILTAKFKNTEKTYCSDLEQCPFDKITVIISSKTASAAEILAADLQESGVAKVIGVNSFGKTSIQSFYKLENGGAFKITCGKYLTRNGTDITGVGVTPDIVCFDYPVMIKWNEKSKQILKK